jgi:hypothetical protein
LTIASSDKYAILLDQLQYRLGQGPCLTTLRTGEVVLYIGSDDGNRWPLYRMQGEAAGLGKHHDRGIARRSWSATRLV